VWTRTGIASASRRARKSANFRTRHIAGRARERLAARRDRRSAEAFRERTFSDTDELVEAHFAQWVPNDYQSTMPGFRVAFRELAGRPARIVETGTSAWGVDSSRLFDSYVRQFGGEFWSVDLRREPSVALAGNLSERSHLVIGDSVDFLHRLKEVAGSQPIDLFYLDSYDLDWADPAPSEQHGFAEWMALQGSVVPGSLVLIDDTPASAQWIPRHQWREDASRGEALTGHLPGKGARVMKELLESRARHETIWHGYNLLIRIG
jgi:hypothetical protein